MMQDGKLLKGETFECIFVKVPLFIAVDCFYSPVLIFLFTLLVYSEDTYTLTLHNAITRLVYYM